MRKYKPIPTIFASKLGAELRDARRNREITLKMASKKTGIDVGQLSRFERGDFKTASKNLQSYAYYLQISLPNWNDNLEERFRKYAARSTDHRAACELILDALERLG